LDLIENNLFVSPMLKNTASWPAGCCDWKIYIKSLKNLLLWLKLSVSLPI